MSEAAWRWLLQVAALAIGLSVAGAAAAPFVYVTNVEGPNVSQ